MRTDESMAIEVVPAPRWGEDAATQAVALAGTGQYRAFTEAWLANRQLADATRDAYRGDLGGYLDWCAGITTTEGTPGRPEPIDPLAAVFVHINEYARALENTIQPRTGQPYTAASIARKLSAIGSWYTFLVRLGVLPRNPVDGADRPTVDRDHSPTIGVTADEATALVAAAGTTVDELDPAASLFATATATGGRLHRSEVFKLVRRLARAAGLPHWADLSTHGMRHTLNTIAKLAGATLEERQHALGHADPRTTQIHDRARDNLARDPSTLVENATAGQL